MIQHEGRTLEVLALFRKPNKDGTFHEDGELTSNLTFLCKLAGDDLPSPHPIYEIPFSDPTWEPI